MIFKFLFAVLGYSAFIFLVFASDEGRALADDGTRVSPELKGTLCSLARAEKKVMSECQDVVCLEGVWKKYASTRMLARIAAVPDEAKQAMLKNTTMLKTYFTPEGMAKSHCEVKKKNETTWEVRAFFKLDDGGETVTDFIKENGEYRIDVGG